MAFIYDLSDTWNNGGTVFNGIKMDVLNIASAAGSRLLSLKIGGVDQAYVDKNGNGYFSGTLAASSLSLVSSLPVTSGGTGVATLTSGYLVKGNGTAAASASVVYDDGTNVGIGTSSPGAKLTVYDTSNAQVLAQGTTSYAQFQANNTSGSFHFGVDNSTGAGFGAGAYGRFLYSTGAYPMAFFTNSAERMRLDASGNLGIGTTSPSQRVDVTVSSGTEGAGLAVTNSLAGGYGSGVNFYSFRGDGTTKQVAGSIQMGGQENWSSDATVSSYMRFYTVSDNTLAERMRLDASGNLGIGTTSVTPVFGTTVKIYNAGNGGTLEVGGSTVNARFLASQGLGQAALGTSTNHPLLFSTNDTERARFASTGQFSIASTSTTAALNLGGSADISMKNTANTSGFDIGLLGGSADATAYIYQRAAAPITFATSNTERARIDSSGNLLVGTTSSGLVDSHNYNYTVGSGRGYYNHVTGTGSGADYLIFGYATTQIGSITQNGTTGVLYNTSSDARLKHDIIDAPEASTLIDQIKVRSFKWNADDSTQRYGFIAQELLPIAPEAVSQPEDPDAMMGVDYSKLVPMLVKEIQDLRARVAQLEGN